MNTELLNEQAFKNSCQEIDDLYSLLRHKNIHVDHLDEFTKYQREHGEDLWRRTSF